MMGVLVGNSCGDPNPSNSNVVVAVLLYVLKAWYASPRCAATMSAILFIESKERNNVMWKTAD